MKLVASICRRLSNELPLHAAQGDEWQAEILPHELVQMGGIFIQRGATE